MKKNRIKFISFCAGLFLALTGAYGSGVPNVDVMVSDPAGRLAYRGKTDANGVFATRRLAAGNYVVQFKANKAAAHRNDYAIFAAAGHHRVVADAVSGAQIAGGGVELRLKSATGTLIIGQVALGGVEALRTKIVNGVRYVLLPPETGDLGPRWVEEGSHSKRNISRIRDTDPNMVKANPSGLAQ